MFRQMFTNGKFQWIPFVITVIAVVRFDLLTGVGLGLVASIIAILYGNLKNSYYFHQKQHKEGEVIHIRLSEEVSFLNKASIKLTLEHLPENATVLIDATATHYIDFDVLELIREFNEVRAPLKNINCILMGFQPKYKVTNTYNVQSEALPVDLMNNTAEAQIKTAASAYANR